MEWFITNLTLKNKICVLRCAIMSITNAKSTKEKRDNGKYMLNVKVVTLLLNYAFHLMLSGFIHVIFKKNVISVTLWNGSLLTVTYCFGQ